MALLLQDRKTNHSDCGSRENKKKRSQTRMRTLLGFYKKSRESDLRHAQMTKQWNCGPRMVSSCKLSKAIRDLCLLSKHYQVAKSFQEVTIAPWKFGVQTENVSKPLVFQELFGPSHKTLAVTSLSAPKITKSAHSQEMQIELRMLRNSPSSKRSSNRRQQAQKCHNSTRPLM